MLAIVEMNQKLLKHYTKRQKKLLGKYSEYFFWHDSEPDDRYGMNLVTKYFI